MSCTDNYWQSEFFLETAGIGENSAPTKIVHYYHTMVSAIKLYLVEMFF